MLCWEHWHSLQGAASFPENKVRFIRLIHFVQPLNTETLFLIKTMTSSTLALSFKPHLKTQVPDEGFRI